MTVAPPIPRLLLLVAPGFFLGLAFEEFHARANQKRPGGIRTFPLLALTGALLFLLDPTNLLPFSAGLLALSAWLTCYYWRQLDEIGQDGLPNVGLMVPICNVLAYLPGPVALADTPVTGIVLATSVMYLRLLIVIAVFNQKLALAIAPAMLGLTVMGLPLAGVLFRFGPGRQPDATASITHGNPLELGAPVSE
jgi:uncharacterized membrane protein (DUF4010 family)